MDHIQWKLPKYAEPASLASCFEGSCIDISALFRSVQAGTSDLSGFAVLMQFYVMSEEGSVSDSVQLWANQYSLINYSSTCYVIPENNHLYLLPRNSNNVPAVTDFQNQYRLLLNNSQLNSVDLSTDIYVLVPMFLWKYTCIFSAVLQINFNFLSSLRYSKGKNQWVQLCSNSLGPCIKGEGDGHYGDDSAEPSSDGWRAAGFWP